MLVFWGIDKLFTPSILSKFSPIYSINKIKFIRRNGEIKRLRNRETR